MRNKIDYGIDLGTTNSAIARMENGVPVIKKSDTLKDTVPSCVHYNKRKDILVGDTAFNVFKNDRARALKTPDLVNSNTFIEFKRTMGTTHKYECTNMGKEFNSEELSAEVLKKLKSFIQDENVSSVVITVPAKFLNPQNEATMKAANLAGFKHVQLLQEPVAAATAYGLGSNSKDGYWLVFDFGGGTFDAALLKSTQGILAVKDTEGDNWLGGKDLDSAIVDELIIPNIQANYSIDSLLNDSVKKELLRDAVKPYAEEAKIQLSFKDTHNILSDLGALPFEDDNGDEPEIDLTVTQKDMERVVAPIFQKAIDYTKELLKRNHLKGSELSALILVGGPTFSPILRRMLKEQITENVDTSVDPMTVVAKGAALYASTISVSEEIKEATRDKAKLQIDLKYEGATTDTEEMVNVKILKDKTTGNIPEKVFIDVVRFDGGWSSGKKQITEKATIVDVLLVEGRPNGFQINAFDDKGDKIECQPNEFNILQGISGLDNMQVLPYNICIAKYFPSEDKDLIMPIPNLEKSKPIKNGLVGQLLKNKTRNVVRPGMASDEIRIPIYEGDYGSEGSNPLLNNLIREVVITGEDLPALLPEGSEVDITIKIDSSRLMQFSAYFPLLDYSIELEIDINNTEPPTEKSLRKEIQNALNSASKLNSEELKSQLQELEIQLDNEKGNAPGRMKIFENLRKELLKIDDLEKNASWPQLESELKSAFFELEDLITKIKNNSDDGDLNMSKVEAHISEYKSSVDSVIRAKDSKEARRLTREIGQLDFELRNAVTGNAMDVQFLRIIDTEFDTYHWKDRNRARQLVNQGLSLSTQGKTNAIRPILVEIINLMPEDEKPGGTLR
jgi:molecular chaperone DnaK